VSRCKGTQRKQQSSGKNNKAEKQSGGVSGFRRFCPLKKTKRKKQSGGISRFLRFATLKQNKAEKNKAGPKSYHPLCFFYTKQNSKVAKPSDVAKSSRVWQTQAKPQSQAKSSIF